MNETLLRSTLLRSVQGLVAVRDFSEAVAALGVRSGDVVMVHSDLSVFGALCVDASCFVDVLTDVLVDAVGERGVVLMPTFNFDACHGVPFDPDITPGRTGSWGRRWLRRPDIIRACHPVYSFAVRDKTDRGFTTPWADAYGSGSAFERLHDAGGKILFWGVGFQFCTFIHYVEQRYGVPYRFMKHFEVGDQRFTMYCRDLSRGLNAGLDGLETVLRVGRKLLERQVGDGVIGVVGASDVYATACEMLDRDIYSLTRPEETTE